VLLRVKDKVDEALRDLCLDDKDGCSEAPAPGVRLVIFDFDQTISTMHVFKFLAGWDRPIRKGQGKGVGKSSTQLGQLRLIDAFSEEPQYVDGFPLHALGGRERVERLRAFFADLRTAGAELVICSKGLVAAVQKCLLETELLQFFTAVYARTDKDYPGSRAETEPPTAAEQALLGTRDNASWDSKAGLIKVLMGSRGLCPEQALLVEDDQSEIRAASGICRTEFVRKAQGMTEDNFAAISSMVSEGVSATS